MLLVLPFFIFYLQHSGKPMSNNVLIVKQILNNNVVSVMDQEGLEMILTGRGLGFNISIGAIVDESKVEKIFKLNKDDSVSERLKLIIEGLPLEVVQLTTDIVELAKSELNKKFSDGLFVVLADHLNFAIKRLNDGIELNNPLEWEVKNYYKTEFDFAVRATQMVLKKYGIFLPEAEACSIALHIVNAQLDKNIIELKEITKLVFQVQNIVKYFFRIHFNDQTLNYQRFITHLKFFAQRVLKGELLSNEDSDYLDIIKNKNQKVFDCVIMIGEFLKKNYNHKMTDSEMLYLAIHIENLVREAS